jgi:hypothetical protein
MSSAKDQSWWLTLARGEADAWTVVVSAAQPSGTHILTYVEEELEALVTATVTEATAHVTDLIWRHELAAFAYQNRSRTLGMARQMVHASHEANFAGLTAQHPSKEEASAVAFAVRAMLGRKGRVRGRRKQIRLEQVKWLVAAIAAWPALMASILRYGGASPERLRPAEVVHAVHGEWETRTRHLLPPSYDPGQDPQYLIIGRPCRSLRDIAVMLGEKSGLKDANLIRPLDVSAAVRALIPGLRKIVHGIDVAASGPIQVGWRDCWALTYRMMQGAAYRQWWQRRRCTPQTVLFGHTGTADTSQLELEMQTGGTKTIHMVHGINHGWPFAGVSSLGLFKSKHDAELGEAIGAYGETACIPSNCPEFKPGGQGWLVLTSYTHPMGRPYAIYGVEPDIKTLDLVADAARLASVPPGDVMWRPHPAIEKVKREDRDALEACVTRHGFTRWPQGQPLEAIQSFAVIVTTPSTILLDALHLGKCPILVTTAPLQKDLIYAAYPRRADSAHDLYSHVPYGQTLIAFAGIWNEQHPEQVVQPPENVSRQPWDIGRFQRNNANIA